MHLYNLSLQCEFSGKRLYCVQYLNAQNKVNNVNKIIRLLVMKYSSEYFLVLVN